MNTPDQFFTHYTVYSSDVELLRKLGLKLYYSVPNHKTTELGKINGFENIEVSVSVVGAPAQFFTFKVTTKDNTTKFTTGSGSFQRYWKLLKYVLEEMDNDMLGVTVGKGVAE